MYVTLEELSTNPRKQVRARLVRSCTVVLTSGMEIEFDRLLRSYTYRGDMSEQDKKEFEKWSDPTLVDTKKRTMWDYIIL